MLNFALIGCGRIGKRHAELIRDFGVLQAVCDIKAERAEEIAGNSGASVYSDLTSLLQAEKGISVVVICTPNGLHAEQAVLALQAGCHVLCEKPMAIRADDCKRMMDAAAVAGKQLLVVKQNRFNPPVVALKKLIDEGRLGRIFNVQVNCFWNRNADYYRDSWRGSMDLDGGTLFTQFSHFIDLLHWMIGDVKNTQAVLSDYMHRRIIQFEDTGVVLFEFESGAMGSLNYTVNSHNKNMEGSITVFGERGTVKVGGQYLNELEYQDIEGYEIPALLPGSRPNDYGSYMGSMSNHEKVYENLVGVIGNSMAPAADGMDGWKTVRIIEKIYQTARKI